MSTTPNADLPFARAFWELRVYQKCRSLQGDVFRVSKTFPLDELHSLTDQMRRAARSIGAQIAEAWAKRDYIKHFQSKLSDAESENMETQHWLITAVDDGYLTSDDAKPFFQSSLEIGRMLASMIDRAEEFCPDSKSPTAREDSLEFYLGTDERPSLPWLD